MGALILGIYLAAVALQGNAQALLGTVSQQKAFVPWLAAIGVLYFIWQETPPKYQPLIRGLIGAALLGMLVTNAGNVRGQISNAWTQIKSFGGSTTTTTTTPTVTGA